MTIPEPESLAASAWSSAPDRPAVFLLWPAEGARPYLGRTTVLRRRLARMLGDASQPGRWLRLGGVATRVDWWRTAGTLESALVFYAVARRHFPDDYLKLTRLRWPAYVRVILSNRFPRTQITTRLAGRGTAYGPFSARAAAEQFESQFLDLFQVRRCQEDLDPSPAHPGCIYGEMNMCLRPCQQVVTVEEYSSEVRRAVEFLETSGRSLASVAKGARERSSNELDFEEAARLHKRLEKIEQVIKLAGDLAADVDRLNGLAVSPSIEPGAVEIRPVLGGFFQPPVRFRVADDSGRPVSLERRLREAVPLIGPAVKNEREEHLALLTRWFHSTWRDGEWVAFDGPESVSWRKVAGAVHRVAGRASAEP